METTTWPALLEQTIIANRDTILGITGRKITQNESDKEITLCLSGINVRMSQKESAEILRVKLIQEQEEYLAICKKYNALGLKREAIVPTQFFNSIVRKADVLKDLFFFETFDEDGMVYANIKSLSGSREFFSAVSALEEYIDNLKSTSEFDEKHAGKLLANIIRTSVLYLWPKRTDMERTTSMRKISAELPDAPERTKNRLIEWNKKGFTPKVIAHKDAITPVLPQKYFRGIATALELKKDELELAGEDADSIDLFLNSYKGFGTDPIFHVTDGKWTIIVDQYADFPKEKEIIGLVKSHYNLLGTRYGILEDTN